MDTETRAFESRLRRAAAGVGYKLLKSKSRNPASPDFGLFALIDPDTGGAVNPSLAQRWTCSWTLEQVDSFLTRAPAPATVTPASGYLH